MNNVYYQNEIKNFAFDLTPFAEKTLLISGGTGMIGRYLVDVLMTHCPTCRVIVLGRSREKARARFGEYFIRDTFRFCEADIEKTLDLDEKVDFVIHAASNTHPVAYSTDPIGTITANVFGLKNLLDYTAAYPDARFAFISSVEIYGENRGDVDAFDEDYCGYLNCNTLRAGYPESKRVGETLCQAYIKQKNMNIVIPRLPRIFGPTLLESDTKALSQFLHKGLKKEDIVLKSAGTQFFSYLYVADAVTGILTCLLKGKCGEAYNLSSESCNISLKDLAAMIAEISDTKIVFELPDAVEKAGYSTATKAIQNAGKLMALGWMPHIDMRTGLEMTLKGLSV